MDKIAVCNDFFTKKVVAKEIFGSNLHLHNKRLRVSAPKSELKKGGKTLGRRYAPPKKKPARGGQVLFWWAGRDSNSHDLAAASS